MTTTSQTASTEDTLRETAKRLIETLGVDGAIFVCRSNYWHGVLRLIEERLPVSSAPA
ncbi:MAG: hypothetical protein AAF543_22410 [Pseudomonadota bacterium]